MGLKFRIVENVELSNRRANSDALVVVLRIIILGNALRKL